MSYEASDDGDEEMVLGNSNKIINNYNVVSKTESNDKAEEYFFQQQIEEEIKVTFKTN